MVPAYHFWFANSMEMCVPASFSIAQGTFSSWRVDWWRGMTVEERVEGFLWSTGRTFVHNRHKLFVEKWASLLCNFGVVNFEFRDRNRRLMSASSPEFISSG